MKTCVFAGSFDPFTKGHEYVVDKSLKIFDKVIIAVGKNDEKKPLLTQEERINFIKKVYENNDKVEITCFDGMLVDFMKERDILATIRGIRNADDYKYETTMAQYNLDMYPEIVTIYIPTPLKFSHVSSSAIRTIIGLNGDFSEYLPANSLEYLKEVLKNKKK